MTVYTALRARRNWENTITESEPLYQKILFVLLLQLKHRSLTYLVKSKWGRYIEKAIALELKLQALRIHQRQTQDRDRPLGVESSIRLVRSANV